MRLQFNFIYLAQNLRIGIKNSHFSIRWMKQCMNSQSDKYFYLMEAASHDHPQGSASAQPQNSAKIYTPIDFPIVSSDPNKFLAYENEHMQIWMRCIKHRPGQNEETKLIATYVNKFNSPIENLQIMAAVLKHITLTLYSSSSSTLGPFSREKISQVMYITNPLVGQKGLAMKIKLDYCIGSDHFHSEGKINPFPPNI